MKLTQNSISKNIYIVLAVYIVGIILVSYVIYYLNSLKNCQCFQEKNKENYSNLNYLIIIESIILGLNVITALIILSRLFTMNSPKQGGGSNASISLYIVLILYLLIFGYFIYYVYKLYENVDVKCECSENWIRYLLYIQAIIMIIEVLLIIYILISTITM